MTNRQKIELRLSKVRTRLNEIAGLEGDEFTDEVRSELDELETEYGDLERRFTGRRSSPRPTRRVRGRSCMFPDGTEDTDGAEVRQLLGRVATCWPTISDPIRTRRGTVHPLDAAGLDVGTIRARGSRGRDRPAV